MIPKVFTGAAMAAALSTVLVYAPDASAQQQQGQMMQNTAPAQVQQVRGRILDVRVVPINKARAQNVLVLLETPQGNRVVVDLGDRLSDVNFRPGDDLRARGEVVKVGENRPLLMANMFQYQGRTRGTNRVAYSQQEEQPGGYGSGQR